MKEDNVKFTANRLELLSAAQDALTVAPDKSPMDVLECTYLATEDGKLTVAAGNLETALERRIPVKIKEEGLVIINAKLLVEMLRRMAGDTVSISQKDGGRVEIKSGDAYYGFGTLDAKMYPRMDIPFPADTVTVTGIPTMAKRTVFAVSEEEGKPLMKCVHLIFDKDGLRAVSSDSYRIAAAKGDSKSAASVDMLIPATSLEKLSRLVANKDELQVGTTGKTVVFMKEDFSFSARLMEGNYFDENQMFSRVQSCFMVLTDAETLRRTMSLVYAVTGEQNRFSITFDGTHLRMACESEFGTSNASTEVVALTGNPAGKYWYNPAMLYDCLKAQSGTMMLELAQNGALLMKTDELVCMQVAMREPKPIERKAEKPKAAKEKPKKAATEKKPRSTRKKKKEADPVPEAA